MFYFTLTAFNRWGCCLQIRLRLDASRLKPRWGNNVAPTQSNVFKWPEPLFPVIGENLRVGKLVRTSKDPRVRYHLDWRWLTTRGWRLPGVAGGRTKSLGVPGVDVEVVFFPQPARPARARLERIKDMAKTCSQT